MTRTKTITDALIEAPTRNPNNRVSINPLKRRLGTYDGILVAPMSLMTLLLVKTAVRAFFAIGSAAFRLLIGVVV
jgi:hypothetical protein